MKKDNKLEVYNDFVSRLYFNRKPNGVREITFQITSDCNLNCSYCYEHHKKHEKMSLETGQKIIDYILSEYELDEPSHLINKKLRAFIFTFIGGEPFLEVDLIDQIMEYFFTQSAKKGCSIAPLTKISISTNGMLYFTPKVQAFLNKYRDFLGMTVSIDGIKQLHDAHRITPDGHGSFDMAYKAFCAEKKYNPPPTKMTFVPESLKYIYDSIIFMIESGAGFIACNCAYEPIYAPQDAKELYQQLKKVADYLIEKKIGIYLTIFEDSIGKPYDPASENYNRNFCGGTGNMLCFDPKGNAYPCVRFAPISIAEKSEGMKIGSYNGLFITDKEKAIRDELESVTMESQSPEKCLKCSIATGCGWCSAFNYEETGSVNKRITNICWAHKGRVAATYYYFNKWYLTFGGEDIVPKKVCLSEEDALQFLTKQEWQELKELEEKAFDRYNSFKK